MKNIHLLFNVMPKLPSLNALQVFETVARHMSFQQAAKELDVTPTAVSHQIKVLEDSLGIMLFRRRPRPLALTKAGEALYPAIRDGFDTIERAIAKLTQIPEDNSLTVSVTPVFAAKFLVPRLSEFQQAHPEIDLRLQASNAVVDLRTQGIDLAIRYGRGNYQGFVVRKLMSDVFVPVCSPRLLDDQYPLNKPSDLKHYPLLHFEWIHYGSDAPNWKTWLTLAGVDNIDYSRGAKFDEETLAIQAAIAAQGVALCSSVHVADDVALGFLLKPLELSLAGYNYYAVYLKNRSKEESILKLVEWLVKISNVPSV